MRVPSFARLARRQPPAPAWLIWLALVSFAGLITACGGPQADATIRPESKPAVARQFTIEGMTCQGCADTVTEAVAKLPGVERVEVSLQSKRARVVADPSVVSDSAIAAAVAKAGYQARPIPSEHAVPEGPDKP